MVERIINGSVSFMIRMGAVSDTEEQRDVYRYGMELQVYYIIHAVILLFIGLLFGRTLEVALLLFTFGLVQTRAGGYHADTHKKCFLIMVAGVSLFIFILPIYHTFIVIRALSVVFGLLTILCFSPISNKNHSLCTQISKQMGRDAKIIACVIAFIWFVIDFFEILPVIDNVVAIVMAFTGISMLSALIKMRLTTNANNPIISINPAPKRTLSQLPTGHATPDCAPRKPRGATTGQHTAFRKSNGV